MDFKKTGKFILALITLFIVGCAEEEHGFYVHPELSEYWLTFKDAGEAAGKNFDSVDLDMDFGQLSGIDGRCRWENGKVPKVIIDKDRWDTKSETEREVLVLHELGHCLLRRKHSMDKDGGYPTSIMFPITDLVAWSYRHNREKYVFELFGKASEDETVGIIP